MEYHFLAHSQPQGSPGSPTWKWRTAPLFLSFVLHLLVLAAMAWWTPRPRTVQWVDLRLVLPGAPVPAQDQVIPRPPTPASRPLAAPPEIRQPPAPAETRPQRKDPPSPASAKLPTPTPAAEPVPVWPRPQKEPAPPEGTFPAGKAQPAKLVGEVPLPTVSVAPAAGEAGPGPISAPSFQPGERERYLARLREQIEQALQYPATARRMRWTGTVQVSFLVSAEGAALNLEIRTSCGHPLLDREALQAVRRAMPFAQPPRATEVVLPIIFELR